MILEPLATFTRHYLFNSPTFAQLTNIRDYFDQGKISTCGTVFPFMLNPCLLVEAKITQFVFPWGTNMIPEDWSGPIPPIRLTVVFMIRPQY